ncbi:hypothetical protein FIBSPDRAFT_883324 [Athelia psychrophila]|uniref:DUF6534 domain-containing protein n=1 Tax=Athelia psychrophila TaxID=1759441 RepID=A0A166UCK1_9AGAM|nr:hypothetical protein FIBSPDRAFT_883324 [Fibularhizoctonia sp. CBS 109695]
MEPPILLTGIGVNEDAWGFILIGCFISLILLGIILSQAFTYSQNCEKDRLWQKWFVGIVVVLDAASSALAMAWMYQLFIDGWGSSTDFVDTNFLLAGDPMLDGIISCMVQLFFAWRIHIIARRPWLTVLIVFCAFASFCGAFGAGIAILWVKKFSAFDTLLPVACAWQVSTMVCDIAITVAITYHLRRHKGGIQATDRMLDRIIQLTLQNGLLTALASLMDLILYLSTPKPFHVAFTFLMPKLYANTVLSSLNARKGLLTLSNAVVEPQSETETRPGQQSRRTPELFVEIHQMTDTDSTRRSLNKSEL